MIELSIIVPAFNETARLGPTLESALRYCREQGRSFELVPVDDASTDRTWKLMTELASRHHEIRPLHLEPNRGKGFAIRTGIAAASGERVLFMDADGATPMPELARLEAALARGADVAIGSRAVDSHDIAVEARWYRRLIGRTFHWLVQRLVGVDVRDTQCGFKLFTAQAARTLFSRCQVDRFAFDVELLAIAGRQGLRVVEVPVNWVHQPGSRIHLVRDSAAMAADLWRIRRRLRQGAYD